MLVCPFCKHHDVKRRYVQSPATFAQFMHVEASDKIALSAFTTCTSVAKVRCIPEHTVSLLPSVILSLFYIHSWSLLHALSLNSRWGTKDIL